MARKTVVVEPTVIDIDGLMPIDQLQSQQQALAVIETPEQAQGAGLFLREVRQAIRNIKRHYAEVRKPVKLALDDLKRQENEKLAPYLAAEQHVDAPLIAWQIADRERVAREKQEQLQRARAQEEARRSETVAQLKSQAATAKGTEKAVLKAQARILEAAPLTPQITEPMPEVTKIEGVSLREYWYAEVIDFALLVTAVAEGRAPLSALQPNQKFLDERAEALQRELSYPGVIARRDHGQTARGV